MRNWNKDYAASISKEQWIKEHAHHKDEFDLEAEYDKMVPVEKEAEKAESKAKAAKKSNQ
jgi:hypothetical protein